jgi:Fe-Mn family superoxide dismutase
VRPTPDLVFDAEFRELGVGGLFSDTGYRLGWTTYQKMMLQKLDELLAGEPDENADVKALLLKYARDPQSASVFNHASMAFNNHFFYQALSTTPMKLDRYNLLEQSLTKTFGSIDTLRTTFLDTAAAMFAPGFVWLVWCKDAEGARAGRSKGAWRILTTYAAGTPFPEAGYRQQGIDANTSSPASYEKYQATNALGSFGQHSQLGQDAAKIPPGGTTVAPVLCVSTWEHSYIYDFGLNGKRKYLSDWWSAIDWYRVEQRTPKEAGEAAGRSLLG